MRIKISNSANLSTDKRSKGFSKKSDSEILLAWILCNVEKVLQKKDAKFIDIVSLLRNNLLSISVLRSSIFFFDFCNQAKIVSDLVFIGTLLCFCHDIQIPGGVANTLFYLTPPTTIYVSCSSSNLQFDCKVLSSIYFFFKPRESQSPH